MIHRQRQIEIVEPHVNTDVEYESGFRQEGIPEGRPVLRRERGRWQRGPI